MYLLKCSTKMYKICAVYMYIKLHVVKHSLLTEILAGPLYIIINFLAEYIREVK